VVPHGPIRSIPRSRGVHVCLALLPLEPQFADYARNPSDSTGPSSTPSSISRRGIHATSAFDAAATTVATPLSQVLEQRRGVCQTSRTEIACLRALGLPARYVSGYLETVPPPGQARLLGLTRRMHGSGSSVLASGGLTWTPRTICSSLQHITLGWGRDYSDVAPIHGIVVGGDEHVLKVSVDVDPQGAIEIEALKRSNG
jgi:transglutaminase-like putative cysteine protease